MKRWTTCLNITFRKAIVVNLLNILTRIPSQNLRLSLPTRKDAHILSKNDPKKEVLDAHILSKNDLKKEQVLDIEKVFPYSNHLGSLEHTGDITM